MEFTKYPKMANVLKTAMLDKVIDHGYGAEDVPWIATEKVHGANFALHFDVIDASIKISRRSGFLEEGEVFYAHTKILPQLKTSMAAVWKLIGDNVEREFVVRGEIFGGGFYEEQEDGSKQVQKEIQYSPATEFMAFDLMVDGEYVKPMESHVILSACGFKMVPVVEVYQTFLDALEANPEFESLVPKALGHEPKLGNWAEGMILRPFAHELRFNNGDRVIFKHKSPHFKEKSTGTKSVPTELSAPARGLLESSIGYLNENRVAAVISKEAEPTQKDFGKFLGLFVQDALEDFADDHGLTMKELKKVNEDIWKEFNKAFKKKAVLVLRGVWVTLF